MVTERLVSRKRTVLRFAEYTLLKNISERLVLLTQSQSL